MGADIQVGPASPARAWTPPPQSARRRDARPDDLEYAADPGAWAEPRCGLAMLDSQAQVTRQPSQKAFDQPATRIARIQGQRAVDHARALRQYPRRNMPGLAALLAKAVGS